MTTPPYEVVANDTALLTFDGRVLDMETVIGQPGVPRHSLPYDPERLDALRAFAAQPARGVAERPRL
ncbi:hypothetical protein [Streptomyces sp. NL15-2K]|uniref:hypothetical protein n=1 Tax=Streptomyces sp. NL15-2K TaxID=376149 RepID=UPI000F563740|nr:MULTISPECIES: hypothetical protein [Actinomycetes]WKX14831.1 hypothetical protein Q4V64_48005 [Kutzneria buriramensis]GCB51757.1 hypothetical protein SNL152K_9113 [Streptomyces sp. NL15-2K]